MNAERLVASSDADGGFSPVDSDPKVLVPIALPMLVVVALRIPIGQLLLKLVKTVR